MLEKLFTSKTRIKIMEFFFFIQEESYLREISNKIKVSPSAVKRELSNLEKAGIINKVGNKLSLNIKSNIVSELKNIFIKTDYLLFPIKEALDKKIKYALIFGSFARGEYSSESDIDLLVIGEIKSLDLHKKLKKVEKRIQREINPVIWSIDNLKKEKSSGFIKDIFKKKIIMLKGDENEVRRIIK